MTEEWASERLDLAAYLARIGYAGELRPTAATLTGLHRAHLATIPFENLDVVLGRGVRVDIDSVQTKLVGARRGGYCYEQVVLFAAALDRLGFAVDRLLARVGQDERRPPPRTHLALRVEADGERWLADVGFGAGLLEPVRWDEVGPVRQGEWTFHLAPTGPHARTLRQLVGDRSVPLYEVADEPQHHSDVEVANHWSSTHPASPFVGTVVAMRRTPETQLRLRGRELRTSRPGRHSEVHVLTDAEFAATLRDRFDLRLTDGEVADLLTSGARPALSRCARVRPRSG